MNTREYAIKLSEEISLLVNRQMDDDFLSVIRSSVHDWTVKLLKQAVDTKGFNNLIEYMQSFDVPLVKDDLIDLCSIKGCVTLRTKERIPKGIRNTYVAPYFNVGTIDKQKSFTFILPNQLKFLNYSPLTSNHQKYTVINGYIYIFNSDVLKWLNIQHLFTEPLKVAEMANCINCDVEEDSIYIPEDFTQTIRIGVMSDLRIMQPDTVISSQDDVRKNQ